VLIDNNVIVDIFVFDEISCTDCVQIEEISRDIYSTGGVVKHSNSEGSDKMIMCG